VVTEDNRHWPHCGLSNKTEFKIDFVLGPEFLEKASRMRVFLEHGLNLASHVILSDLSATWDLRMHFGRKHGPNSEVDYGLQLMLI
jgi:hypothetical protein